MKKKLIEQQEELNKLKKEYKELKEKYNTIKDKQGGNLQMSEANQQKLVVSILDWFDETDVEHIQAWANLEKYGFWPEGFVPDNIEFPQCWQVALAWRMAKRWTDHIAKQGGNPQMSEANEANEVSVDRLVSETKLAHEVFGLRVECAYDETGDCWLEVFVRDVKLCEVRKFADNGQIKMY